MATTYSIPRTKTEPEEGPQVTLRCPSCHSPMASIALSPTETEKTNLYCRCGFEMKNVEGIWRALDPQQQSVYRPFLRDYEEIRRREKRGSSQAAFYLALPFCDLTGQFSWAWKIRARSFRTLEKEILPELEKERAQPLRILDLGSGNGWLSYRLSLRKHYPVAVDLSVDTFDGLGAAYHYQPVLYRFFPRLQASMDKLPFADGQFDVAIFNASFHYSVNYEATVREALRCLTPQGKILIIDSPTYTKTESGERMLQERQKYFLKQYGFASNQLPCQEFLTPSMLMELEKLGIRWKSLNPWRGIKWALRPLIARLRGKREPSNFYIYLGHVRRG